MTKKTLILLSSGALIALLLVGVAGWTFASQESTPTSNASVPFGSGGRGGGGRIPEPGTGRPDA